MGIRRVPLTVAIVISAMLVATLIWLRLALVWRVVPPIGYGVPLVIIASFRRRTLLWGAVAAFLLAALYKYFYLLPHANGVSGYLSDHDYHLADMLVTADLLVVGAVMDLWIRSQDRVEFHAAQLQKVNSKLRSREAQIEQNNEMLRLQSAKLELQSGELRQVIQELDVRRREAEEASIRKTRFLAAVSHDIRTPANAISLLAELVRRTAADPAAAADVAELAGELHASSTSLVNLLSDVLDVARFDSGKIEMQETEFLLGQFLNDECRQLLPLARQKNLDLTCSVPDRPVRIRADRIKLSRIFGNLIGNAIKFTASGTIKVQADEPDQDGITIRVIDSGMGIPREFQRDIFDEFFQVKNPERDRNKGTGLGLAICKRLTDAMGGVLEVNSVAGHGSTFTVKLPRRSIVDQTIGPP